MFEFDNCRLISRMLEGEYINYQKFIQTQNPVKCKGSVRQLKDTFERVSPIISGQKVKSPVKININDDEEYKTRIVKLIDNIIHNDRFDIVSKLDKLYELISLNKSLQEYRDYIKNEYRENIQ